MAWKTLKTREVYKVLYFSLISTILGIYGESDKQGSYSLRGATKTIPKIEGTIEDRHDVK